MRRSPLAIFLLLFLSLEGSAQAQEQAFVNDQVHTWLRSGPGDDFRYLVTLTAGTPLRLLGTSEDGEWAEVALGDDREGWVLMEFVTREPPAPVRLRELRNRIETEQLRNVRLEEENNALEAQLAELADERDTARAQLLDTTAELNRITEVSGNALQLDVDNRQLMEQAEQLRAEIDILEGDNQRLEDKLQSQAFMDGALAVGLGVVITLVVPRLWPRRRRNTGWA